MDPLRIAQHYFDCWNRHDPAALVAAFHDGGTYRDPASGTLTGDAIGRYAAELVAAFPDLIFEPVTSRPAGDGLVTAEWLMRGTHRGSFLGSPATGRAVSLPGADFLTFERDRLRAVTGYFDQKTLAEQLGLHTVVQPHALGPVHFGTAVRMNTGVSRKPGAFSLTCIHLRSPAEAAEVDERGAAILEQLAGTPGFISTVLTTVGLVGHTITAWEDAEAPRRLMTAGAHREAMTRFFSGDLAAGGWTSVWVPARLNASWIRCNACRAIVNYDQRTGDGTCRCGAPLPEPLPYW